MDFGEVFTFTHRTKLITGQRSTARLGPELTGLGLRNALIVTDPGVVAAGLTEPLVASLDAAGVAHVLYDRIEPNPTAESVDEGARWVKEHGCDNVVALGGGSSIDAAKCIAMLTTNGGAVRDYEGAGKFTRPLIHLTAIPTTVGTGSEVTFGAVITDPMRKKKMVLAGELFCPPLAVIDPEMVRGLPASVTAATGMDALTQGIEGYISSRAQVITDALNLEAVRIIARSLRPAVLMGDFLSLARMQIAATMAGMGFINGGLGVVHAMSNTVGGVYGTPHGVTNAVILPHGMRYNLPARVERMADIARAMGEKVDHLSDRDAAEAAIRAVERLARDVGIPPRLSDLGVTDEHIEAMAEEALHTFDIQTNPRRYSQASVAALYREAL